MSLLTSGVEPLQRPYAASVALRLPEGGPLSAAGRGLEPTITSLVVPSPPLGESPARAWGAAGLANLPPGNLLRP